MKKLYTIPNILSILRLLLIPVLVFFILRINDNIFPYMISIYFFAIFLDFLDGFLARKLSQESEIGKILDPIADKLMVLALLFALILKTDFPHWLAFLIIIRDFIILLLSVVLYKGKGIVKSSLPIGKVTFALLSLTILIFIIGLNEDFNLQLVKYFFIVLSFTFIIWSGIEYFLVFLAEESRA